MNELLLFIEIISVFSLLLIANKIFGKTGVLAWIAITPILANIQLMKNIDVLGISVTLGNVMFASNFLATDILSECYGKKEAKKGVYIALFTTITYLVISQISLLYTPNSIDIAQNAMRTLFTLTPRVCIASVLMFFIANLSDVYIYEKLKSKFKGKKIWLRNNISTILCNCLENFGLFFIGFLGVYSIEEILIISISSSIIEIIIAICDTPFLYIAKRMNKKKATQLDWK